MDCSIDRERRIKMTNSRMSRGAQFCENVVQAVFTEAQRFGVSPRDVMLKCVESFNNKAIAIEKANRSNRNDMLDAMRYAFADAEAMSAMKRCFHQDMMSSLSAEFGLVPDRILFSGNRTIVFWNDGDKTVVKCAEGQVFDEYNGFVAALAKKLYGSTSKVKKVIKKTMEHQDLKKEGV
jgi:hypothetical protein